LLTKEIYAHCTSQPTAIDSLNETTSPYIRMVITLWKILVLRMISFAVKFFYVTQMRSKFEAELVVGKSVGKVLFSKFVSLGQAHVP